MKRWSAPLLVLFYLLDALRIRGHATKLHILTASDREPNPEHVFWVAPGMNLDAATKRAASAWADEKNLKVLDLLPAKLDIETTIRMLWRTGFDPETKVKLGKGATAGQVMLVHEDLIARSQLEEPKDLLGFSEAAQELSYHASDFGFAHAPGLEALPEDAGWQKSLLGQGLRGFTGVILQFNLLLILMPALGLRDRKRSSIAIFIAYCAHPLLATFGTVLQPRKAFAGAVFKLPRELANWVKAALAPNRLPPKFSEERSRAYQEDLGRGSERFFEEERITCPICGSERLSAHIKSHDLLMLKPGSFKLDRCDQCGHVFQNPALSLEGLNFYYRDAYDGANADSMQTVFLVQEEAYLSRARRLKGYAEPERWLDVGGGYGHFCKTAREVWPETRFDGLDMGTGIVAAGKRGWVDTAYHGLLPDVAPQIAGTYDVVSMHHVLEHTRDPRVDLKAAHQVLKPGGYLLIEVPNPISPLSKLLGRYWFGWFQPQHLHLLNEANFNRLFEETGFQAIQWHWKEAHLSANFLLAAYTLLYQIAPPEELPWMPATGVLGQVKRRLVWSLSPLVFAVAFVLDTCTGPFLKKPGRTFNYGVLARRVD